MPKAPALLSTGFTMAHEGASRERISPADSSDLPDPGILAAEIVHDLQAALDQFAQFASDLAAPEGITRDGQA